MIYLDKLHASLFITTIYCIATFHFCKSVFNLFIFISHPYLQPGDQT